MVVFPAFASDFEVFPREGSAYAQLSPLLLSLQKVDFTLRVDDPSMNQGQMTSDFDESLARALGECGAQSFNFQLPESIPQDFDFAFTYNGAKVAVEIEKANREKILRDILKCHMYLKAGADFAVVGLPKNYAHKLGVWDLFDFGVERFSECATYEFGIPDKLSKILLLGFNQYEATSGRLITKREREEMRIKASSAVV
jgi:hypothetical protein